MKIKFLSVLKVASAAFFIACAPAVAQWQTPNHSVPIGRGAGTGFKSAAPGTAGQVLTSNGASADPSFKDSVPAVAIENFTGGGCDSPDNTAALVAAVASTGTGPVRVLFNGNCSYTFTQPDALLFSKDAVFIEGAAQVATALLYNPPSGAAGNGTFLHWAAPLGTNPIFNGGISNIALISSNSNSTKVMIRSDAVSHFQITNVNCGAGRGYLGITGGDGSVCYYPKGWDFGAVQNFWPSADRAIQIGLNPNSSGFSSDHWHWENIYTQMVPTRSENDGTVVTNTFAAIEVDPGVTFTSTTFDGFQSWVGAYYGFKFDDTGAVNGVTGVAAGGTGYAAGDILATTGGTCSVQPTIRVVTVSGGAVTAATIADPGVCTVVPPSPAPVAVSGGSSGAQFNLITYGSLQLSFRNVRSEQMRGGLGNGWSFYISPAAQINGLSISDSVWDGGQKGLFLKNSIYTTLTNNSYIGSNSLSVINATAANINDQIILTNNFWNTTNTADFTGMCPIYAMPSPTGAPIGASSTIPPSAFYTRSIAGPCQITMNSVFSNGTFTAGANGGSIGALILYGNTSGNVTIWPQAAAGTYNFNLPTSAGTSGQPMLSGGGSSSPMTFGTLGAAAGGTGNTSYTVGDILYATGATSLGKLADVATGNVLLSGGVGAAPSWGKVALGSAVSGQLPLANGGCGGTNAATCTAALNAMVGDSGSGGTKGLVPAPAAGDAAAGKFLKADGTWATGSGGSGTVTSVTCNGGQTVITSTGTCASPEYLTASRTYYVRTDGNDNCNGMTDAGGSSGNCAFLTVNKATTVASMLSCGGQALLIQVRTGTYTGAVSVAPPTGSCSSYTIQGDTGTPSNVVVSVTSAQAFTINQAKVTIQGFKISTATGGYCILSNAYSNVTLGANEYGACVSAVAYAASHTTTTFSANYTVSGSSPGPFMLVDPMAVVYNDTRTITFTGSPSFSAMYQIAGGYVFARSTTYSGTVTATNKYVITGGTLNAGGAASSIPGTGTSGGTTTGSGFVF